MEEDSQVSAQPETNAAEEQKIEMPKVFTLEEMERQIKRNEQLSDTIKSNVEIIKSMRDKLVETEKKINVLTYEKLSNFKFHSWIKDVETGDQKSVEVEVKFKHASPKLRREHTAYLIKQSKEILAAKKKFDFGSIADKDFVDLTTEDQLIYNQTQDLIMGISDKYKIEFLKLIIDDSQNLTEEKKLLRSPVDSEFYDNIDLGEVEIALISFRAHYNV